MSRFENHPKTNSQELKLFEKNMGILLPEEYKQFLLEDNGGVSDQKLYIPYPNDEEYPQELTALYGIILPKDLSKRHDLRSMNKVLREDWGEWDDKFLIVGELYGGHFRLALCINGDNRGKVFILLDNHFESVVGVANNFTEFLANLVETFEP